MGERGDYLLHRPRRPADRRDQPVDPRRPAADVAALFRRRRHRRARSEAAKANGGTIINDPHEVPGGELHRSSPRDPAGAHGRLRRPKGA